MKCLLLSLLPLLSLAQPSLRLDSLHKALRQTQNYTQKTIITHKLIGSFPGTKPDSIRKYLRLALHFARQAKNQQLEARTYQLIGNYFQDQSQYDESIRLSLKALALYEKINDTRGMGTAYSNMGLTYKRMGDAQHVDVLTRKGLAFGLKAIDFYTLTNDTLGLIRTYNNLGITYRDLHDYTKAEAAYQMGLQIARTCKVENLSVGNLYANSGQLYIDERTNYDTAIPLLEKALVIYKKAGNEQNTEHIYRNLSHLFRLKNDPVRAITYAQKAITISQKGNDIHRSFNSYEALYLAQQRAGLYKDALTNLEHAKALEDSMIRLDKTQLIADVEAKYQTEKKELEIASLNVKNTLQQRQLLLIGAGLFLSIGFLGVLFWQNRKLNASRSLVQKQSEDLKLMMKELHHRVKNNLAIVSSLLRIQSTKLDDKQAIAAVRQGQQRVDAMSLIHQRLYQTDKVTSINIREYISDLAESLMSAYNYHPDEFDLQLTVEQEEIDVDLAISLGLIINELLTNSFKYAYADTARPLLEITLKNDTGLSLEVRDNGVGINMERWQKGRDSFGKKLVAGLTRQIGGTFTIENRRGTVFNLHIPQENLKMAA
jgi:two-component sensor histidine kinase